MISRGVVLRLGVGQLVCWGSTFYLIGAFGDRIAADFGWSLIETQAGFSISLLTMGVVSTTAGRMIDRHGGRAAMVSGSLLAALGCAALAAATGPISYGAAWICLGVAMRLCLYDAAFAALARIAGPEARRAMSQITLFGGLASTVFWPLGAELADLFGWRAACLVFAGCALLTAPLHWTIPQGRFEAPDRAARPIEPAAPGALARSELPAAILFATVVALSNALHYGMSAHIIGVLGGLGVAAGATAWIAALRGVGQSGARLCEVLFGRRLRAVDLNLAAAAGLAASFVLGFWSGASLATAATFSLIYGAATGLLTITRGTLPLALFDPARYGVLVGRLIAPSFVASAAAPVVYGAAIERFGAPGAIWLSLALGSGAFAAAVGLKRLSLRLGR
ncbi:MFS transporter [Hansschlegelia sp.]|uniref:MFS transporter n=1 Tax=Hansschlegelia sp. TaxID=2041892 RepID=UPI002BB7B200|nr:MFS transporter [Hansschlegelia sp.]HVI28429.1 MFS transporter [Hansschlegelia sp.]